MKNLIKKAIKMSCLFGVVAVLAGCMGMCPNQKPMHKKQVRKMQQVEYYQTYNNTDVNQVKAKIYTRSRHGGESKMGYIKFKDTDNGVKMMVDVIDLRPGVVYTPKVYLCHPCASNATTCCSRSMVSADLPRLEISQAGRLEETYTVRGINVSQLQNAQIYLERDGGYKAAWGTFGNDLY